MKLLIAPVFSRALPIKKGVLEALKKAVLGKKYSLSVAVISRDPMRALNRRFRGKNRPTDVLSFPLSRASGEILLCLPEVRRSADRFGRTFQNTVAFLFIHGLLHLKGLRHGRTMEHEEEKIRGKFGI